jgi:2',3'-cyclic-nucleotide 2'-phosphodiesterase (5'-nucleotidase family)
MRRLLAVLAVTGLGAAPAQAVTLTFMHFNDLHAHLTPHLDLIRDAQGGTRLEQKGGIARLATLVKQIRAENPHSVLMNIGDTYHGGAEATFTHGNAIVAPVNALGIDIGVPGNWDFAYGPAVTRLRYAELNAVEKGTLELVGEVVMGAGEIARPNFPNLAANVSFTRPLWKKGDPFLPPTWTRTLGGVKVGFIGITSDIVPEMHSMLATGLKFLQGEGAHVELVERHARALRGQGAQLVVVMSELGIHKDWRLANVIGKDLVDVFFSAHTHELTEKPLRGSSGALVVEAGNDGWLGRMDVEMAERGKPQFNWRLIAIDGKVAEDPAMARLVAEARAPFLKPDPGIDLPLPGPRLTLHQPLDHVVGSVEGLLHRRDALESPFNAAWGEALRQHAQTDIGLSPGFRFDAVLPGGKSYEDPALASGRVTLEDIYRLFPAPYTLSTARIDGARLKALIENNLTAVYSQDAFATHGGWTDALGGLDITLKLMAPDGQRVAALKLAGGKPVNADAVLSVAGCTRPQDETGMLCSYSGFKDVRPLVNPATQQPYYVQELFARLVAEGRIKTLPTAHLHDSAASAASAKLPQWPASPWVQPVWGAR